MSFEQQFAASMKSVEGDQVAHLLSAKAMEYEDPELLDRLGRSTSYSNTSLEKVTGKMGVTVYCHHPRSCFSNSRRGFLKGFWLGFAVKGGINLISGLLFRKMYRKPVALLLESFGADTSQFALFLGIFTGSYKGLNCLLRRLRQKDDQWNSFIAGTLAGTALALDAKGRRSTIALFVLSRALHLVWRYGVMTKRLPNLEHGDALAFTLASAAVMWAWQMEPDTLPSSFRSWISARGGLDNRVVDGMKHAVRNEAADFSSWCKDAKIPDYVHQPGVFVPCSVIHPIVPHSCTKHVLTRWWLGFKSSWTIYAVVHILPLLLFRMKTILKNPVSVGSKTALAIFYSTSFITSFQSIYWAVFCGSRHMIQRDVKLTVAAACLAGGLSVYWEKKSRRPELALFTLPRALESSWKIFRKYGWVRDVPGAHTGLFALSMGFVMMCYQHCPETIKDSYATVLSKYFGKN